MTRWCSDAVLVDPIGDKSGLLRAPTGVLKDFMHYARTGEPWYKPMAILAPTQIVVGELDRETTPEQATKIFEQLGNAREKRYDGYRRGNALAVTGGSQGCIAQRCVRFPRMIQRAAGHFRRPAALTFLAIEGHRPSSIGASLV